MKRRIIHINQQKCNGCGACASACHEGAISMVNGKATLLRDDYCDGLGDCLPTCPTDAITFVEREAAPYNEQAAKANMAAKQGGCPGTAARTLHPTPTQQGSNTSQLSQWPCQIRLMPVQAPYYAGAHLLIAADCTAFACANLHQNYMQGKITIIGCPKLDHIDYSEKLSLILQANQIKAITVARMDVPCCGGMTAAVQQAVQLSGKQLPVHTVVFSARGEVLQED